jgi:nucleoside-triphosphatase
VTSDRNGVIEDGAARPHVLLITGRPGVGKTTVIRKVAAALAGGRLAGFYTEEVRVGGARRGFRLMTFGGGERVMADIGFRSPHRVGRYGVDVAAVDEVAGSELTEREGTIYLVDEIGKMECLSSTFVAAMRRLLDSAATVVATIAERGTGFIAEVKQRHDVELWEVTSASRDELPPRIVEWLARPLRRR